MASIKCGKCKGIHGSAAAVRACYEAPTGATMTADRANHEEVMMQRMEADADRAQTLRDEQAKHDFRQRMECTRNSGQPTATEKQVAFIRKLVAEKYNRPGSAEAVLTAYDEGNVWTTLTKRDASAMIQELLDMEAQEAKVPTAKASTKGATSFPTAEDLPEGRYAIDTLEGAENKLAFYQVDRPTEGKWAGYVFIKLLLGGGTGGDLQPERLAMPVQVSVAKRIVEAGPREASLRFGQEVGVCGVCGRGLTNDDSRAAGIGPVCASNTGW